MFEMSFKIALRYLWRNKTYSLLNFVCLTFGLTCAIVAVLHIFNLFSFDKFHKNYDKLYSVDAYVTYFNGDRFPKQYLSASLTDVLKVQAPEIEAMTRVAGCDFSFVSGEKTIAESGFYADDNFFDLFSFPLLQGSGKVLGDLNAVVISETMAKKFFGNIDCLGKTLTMKENGKEESFKVAAVFGKIPRQSSLQFDFVVPFAKFLAGNSWATETGATANQTWVMLKNSADRKLVDQKIKNLISSQETTLNQELFLFPLKEKVLYGYAGGKRVWKEMQNVFLVGTIGLAILLIACFIFINLAIALNIKRYREAGIKKVVGSGKQGIILQILGEVLIVTVVSMVCAVILVSMLLPGFNAMFRNDIQFQLLNFRTVLFFIGVTLFTALSSGLFPALYLASSNPVNVLKGKMATSHSYSRLRQGLIVFQFIIPIVLIICMMVIQTQDKYMRNYNFGVEQDKLIVLDNSPNLQQHAGSAKAELLAIPGIEAVSFANCIPTRGTRPTSEVSWEGRDASLKLHFWCVNTDFDYNKTVEVKMVEGRYFDRSFSADSVGYLVNDVAARVMNTKDPIGSILTVEGKKGPILGVFKGFHAIDLAGPIVPTILRIKPEECSVLLVKYSAGSFPAIAEKIKKVCQHYDPEAPVQPRLFRDLPSYSNLNTPSNLVAVAFMIALLLACLGFFGLASFTAESRTKEIGIRKTNGATISSIIRLLLTSYAKWLTIATVLALPLAYLLGKLFLGRFHFHTEMPLWAFVVGPTLASVVALVTVLLQTLRAASKNPVKALRYE
jgi:ABC-type antimicrobial peptide transport system permease subunit